MSGSSEGSVPSDGKKVSRRKQGNATANMKRLDISLGYLNNKLEKGRMGLFVYSDEVLLTCSCFSNDSGSLRAKSR